MKCKPGSQDYKQGSKKKLGNKPRIFIKKYEDLLFKKIPDGS
jgi:hypothetical protein